MSTKLCCNLLFTTQFALVRAASTSISFRDVVFLGFVRHEKERFKLNFSRLPDKSGAAGLALSVVAA